ncbi:MAG: porphobilinogen synthase [Parvularculaceae bacterium]|nr:porphobilinogen synthase [Parvularculaceae bacterium]
MLGQGYPQTRLRRLRSTDWSRRLVAETRLSPSDFLWAVVLKEGRGEREPVASMPGVERLTVDQAVLAAKEAQSLGIPALALFPYTSTKDRTADARLAFEPDNLMCRAARAIKDAVPGIGLMADVALDPYTDHGHDGFLEGGEIVNDRTVEALVRQAVVEAKAGYDIVAPSDMMDGRVGAIRRGLDAEGLGHVQIMAYAAKYASCFYGPYRDAIGSSGVLKGDKKTYQMDPANADEALREVAMDIEEGADSVMVKPAGAYLDVILRVKEAFRMPTFAFQVSGEYAMIMAAVERGWIDRDRAILESLLAIRRAGADGIISYFARDAARLLG